jgi:ABC-type glycerol-3-phosphate transport system substrate-binding protein
MKNRHCKVMLSLMFISVLFLPALTYCRPKEKELTFSSWVFAEERLKPTFMALLNTFRENHPRVKIKPVSYPHAQYLSQLIILAASGNAPDVMHIKAEWLPNFLKMGAQKDLTTVISKKMQRDYYPKLLKHVTVKGKIVAAPWFRSPCALYYNKTLLKKAGITKLPANWDELMAAARKISALGTDRNGNRIYGYALPNAKVETLGYNCFPHLWAHGGEVIDKNGKIVVNSAANIAAFTEIRRLYKERISPNGCNLGDFRKGFVRGVIGFYYDLEASTSYFVPASLLGKNFKNEYGVMVIPSKKGPKGYGYITENYLLVSKSVGQDNLKVIGNLLEHLTGPTCLKIIKDGGMEKMPDRVSVSKMNIFSNPGNENVQAFVESLATARSLPIDNENFMAMDDYFSDVLAKLAVTDEPVKKIVTELETKLKKLYKQ